MRLRKKKRTLQKRMQFFKKNNHLSKHHISIAEVWDYFASSLGFQISFRICSYPTSSEFYLTSPKGIYVII